MNAMLLNYLNQRKGRKDMISQICATREKGVSATWALTTMVLCAIVAMLAGCASAGSFQHATATDVRLSENNYRVLQPGAKGGSSGFSLLGIIPITSPSYAVAKARLYKSVGQELRGRSIALANQTQDKSTLYLILFSVPTVTVTADVIEFTSAPALRLPQ